MANRRREPVTYRPFRTEPVLAEGLLAVARPGGEAYEQVASIMFGLAARAGEAAKADATRRGTLAGQADAVAGRPQADVTGKAVSATPGTPVSGDAYQVAAGILRKEEGFREAPYWDVTAFRTGYGSETITKADGSVVKVTKGMKVSREDAERDLARRIPEFEKTIIGQVGAASWSRLPAATKGALISVGYNYGSLPKTVRSAVTGGDAGAIAAAVEGLSANRERRRREASIIRGAAGAPAGAAVPVGVARPPEMAGAGNTVQAGGTFRPRQGNSAYDRAYNEAGVRTYVQQLETEMRDTTSQLFDQFKDDPVALEQALEANRRDMAARHVFPEIMGDFEAGYGALGSRYLGQARDNLAKKVEEQDRADFYERTAALETDRQKRLAAFDPDNPDMADAIASSQKAIDDHYDSAVDKGIYTPLEAAKAKSESRRTAALEYYAKQANGLDADGVKAMREEIRLDFADGGVAGLDGEGYGLLDAGLDKLEKQKRREASDLTEAFRVRGDQMVNRIGAGFEIDPAEMSKLMLDSGRTPQGKAALDETLAKISDARAVRDMTVADATQFVRKLREGMGDAPDSTQLRRLASVELQLEAKRKAIAEDQLSYAESRNLVVATPSLTEAKSAEDMATIMQSRMLTAPKAAAELGVAPRYLKSGEAAALGNMIRAQPETGAAIAAAIVSGAGDQAAAVLAEFGDDAPLVAEAGAILALGGSPQAASDVIAGYGKGIDGKALKPLKPAISRAGFRDVAGDSLALAPKDAARIERAAGSIARLRIANDGLEPDSDEAREVHARAVQEAAGAVFDRGVQFGGFANYNGKVLIPSAIRADAFEDVIAAIGDEDLAGLAQKPRAGVAFWGLSKRSMAATLKAARPVAVSGGFAFAMGDPGGDDPQFVQGDDGEIFVLDLLSLRDRLSPRVPGAFR